MGLFGRKSQPAPVRRDVVMGLIKLGMRETDAADRDIDSPAFDRAKAEFDRMLASATQEEKGLAFAALRRHGY